MAIGTDEGVAAFLRGTIDRDATVTRLRPKDDLAGKIGYDWSEQMLARASRSPSPRSVKVMPLASSLDSRFLSATKRFARELRSMEIKLQPGIPAAEKLGEGIETSAAMFYTATVPMNPLGSGKPNNEEYLNPKRGSFPAPEWRELFRLVVLHLYGRQAPHPLVAIKRDTSSGPPVFTTDTEEKKKLHESFYSNVSLWRDLVLALGAQDDGKSKAAAAALADVDLAPITGIAHRYQIDDATWDGADEVEPKKDRPVTDYKGVFHPAADKSLVFLKGGPRISEDAIRELVSMVRERARTIYTANSADNSPLQEEAYPFWGYAHKEHSDCLADSSDVMWSALLDRFEDVLTADGVQQDMSYAQTVLYDFSAALVECGFPRIMGWVTVFQDCGPILQFSDTFGERGCTTIAHPNDPDTWCARSGNRSGVYKNSAINKAAVLTEIAHRMGKLGFWKGGVVGRLERLKEAMKSTARELFISNRGDNTCGVGLRQCVSDLRAALSAKREDVDGLINFSIDDNPVYEGKIFTRVRGRITRTPNRGSIMQKILHPERDQFASATARASLGVASRAKAAPFSGTVERLIALRTAPGGELLYRLLNEHFSDFYGGNMMEVATNGAKAEQQSMAGRGLTAADWIVLKDPDKLHYVVDVSQLSPFIKDVLMARITQEDRDEHKRALDGVADIPDIPRIEA